MKKILLTGGGTAGHVTPNIALIPSLKEKYDVYYIGSYSGIENFLITSTGVRYKKISTGKLRRYFSWENFKDFFRVFRGTLQAFFYIKKLKPDILFSKGGYVAVPVVLAAKLCHVPVICHESDLSPGIATKISAKFAKKICCTFDECAKLFANKGVYTGTPLRDSLFNGSSEQAKKLYNLDDKPVLLVMGGSQGAKAINDELRNNISTLLNSYNVIHLCGKDKVDKSLENQKGYIQLEYVDEGLADLLSLADIVISRAGSNSIAELHALQKPMLLIPLPKTSVSRGDQIENAMNFEKKGFARVLMQENISNLLNEIDSLYKDKEILKSNMHKNPAKQGKEIIIKIIEENIAH